MNKSVFSFLQATDNAALPTIAAACHAAARLLLTTGVQQSINIFCLLGPQQQIHCSCVW